MQTKTALILPPGTEVKVDELDYSAFQVMLPIGFIKDISSPTKRRPNSFKISLELFIPKTGAPSQDDCSWLLPGSPACLLSDMQIMLMFQPGTINLPTEEEEPSDGE